jgi:hypothetical protein
METSTAVRTPRLDKPIFAGGAASSGTTLLARMLNRHPEIFCGSETALFNKEVIFSDFDRLQRMLPTWLKKGVPTEGYAQYFGVASSQDGNFVKPELLLQCARDAGSLREFVDLIQASCLRDSGKILFAEKTPSNTYCFRQLTGLYPNCLLIHAIRDGRDVVCSLLKRGYDIFAATSFWLYNTASGIACRDLPNYFEYKYEDLVADPTTILKQICERLSVEFDPRMLEPQEGESRSAFGVWTSAPTAPINAKSIGRYKTDLSESDYAIFCHVRLSALGARQIGTRQYSALELLQLLGYAAEPPAQPPKMLRAKLLEINDRFRLARRFIRLGYMPRRALTEVGPAA